MQVALTPVARDLSRNLGLLITSNAPSVWSCPSLPDLPFYDNYAGFGTALDSWSIGYQYFGGISQWNNPAGVFASRSPSKLSTAQPHWVLAADAVMKINFAWGATEMNLGRKDWNGMPPHRTKGNQPAGGNHLLVDGSVHWFKAQSLSFLHNWGGGWSSDRIAYFYQDPKDFDSRLAQPAVLNSLRFRP